MSSFITKIMKKTLQQMNEIDDKVRNQSYKPNPIFKEFDENFKHSIQDTKKSIEKIKHSIHCTKK